MRGPVEREGRENDLFSYLPELGRVRRVTTRSASGSLFGSDFSYEDVERLEHLAETGSSRRLADAVIQGRPVYVLEGTPEPDSGSAYSRVVSYVDRERCVPLRIEFYERVGEIRKVLEAPPEKAVKEGSVWIPTEISMEDRHNGTRSVMRVEEIELDVEIPDRTFSQGALERRR